MKRLAMFSLCCGVLAVLGWGFLAPQAAAIPGDVNADGEVNAYDCVYLIDYLYGDGSPPTNPIDADVDGSPGINMGDLLQLIGYLYLGCPFMPYTGASVRVGSQIRISSDLIFSMESGLTDTSYVKIIENEGPPLTGMVIPLSYANQPHEVEVFLDSVSFWDAIITPFEPGWTTGAIIDNDDKTVTLNVYADYSGAPIPAGSTGVVATLHFTKVTDGDHLAMCATEVSPSHTLMLISDYCADGTPPSQRIFSPKVSLALNGDANCDGIVNLGDIVYLVNYCYKGGPPPCGL